MARVNVVRHEFMDSTPETLQPGTMYVSIKYRAIVHLCLCGCKEKVLLKLDPAPDCWSFTFDGRSISIHDSVGNVGLPCKSHYVVDKNQVRWLPPLLGIDARSALGPAPIRVGAHKETKPKRLRKLLGWHRRGRRAR